MKSKTLVIGASENPGRYSNMAVKRLMKTGHEVVALGKVKGDIDGTPIINEPVQQDDIDTITLYLNENHQKDYYNYIFSLNPRRIIFNPGAENEELEALAEKAGIKTIEACTLVMLSTGMYDR